MVRVKQYVCVDTVCVCVSETDGVTDIRTAQHPAIKGLEVFLQLHRSKSHSIWSLLLSVHSSATHRCFLESHDRQFIYHQRVQTQYSTCLVVIPRYQRTYKVDS